MLLLLLLFWWWGGGRGGISVCADAVSLSPLPRCSPPDPMPPVHGLVRKTYVQDQWHSLSSSFSLWFDFFFSHSVAALHGGGTRFRGCEQDGMKKSSRKGTSFTLLFWFVCCGGDALPKGPPTHPLVLAHATAAHVRTHVDDRKSNGHICGVEREKQVSVRTLVCIL